MTNDNLLTPDEAAERLGVGKRYVLKARREGRLKGQRLGKFWRFLTSEVDRLAGQPQSAIATTEAEQLPPTEADNLESENKLITVRIKNKELKADELIADAGFKNAEAARDAVTNLRIAEGNLERMRASYGPEKAKAARLEQENATLQGKLNKLLASTEVAELHASHKKQVTEIREECEKQVAKAQTAEKMMWLQNGLAHYRWGNKMYFIAYGQVYLVTDENYALVRKIAKQKGIEF